MKVSKKELKQRYSVLRARLKECDQELQTRAALATDDTATESVGPGDVCQLACDELAVAILAKELACGPGS